METSKDQIKAFEAHLDAAYAARPIHRLDASAALNLSAFLTEAASTRERQRGLANAVNDGIVTFAPHLVSGRPGEEPDVEVLLEDLMFGRDYHLIRDLLYYAYNAPGSLSWSISSRRVEIRFVDRTIPRQFFCTWNEQVLLSVERYQGRDAARDRILALLIGIDEFEPSSALEEAEGLIAQEADHKLEGYFSILDPMSDISLGAYTYAQAHQCYRVLLIKALYHRYYSEANGGGGSVFMDLPGADEAISEETGLSIDTVRHVLRDLVFDMDAVRDRLDASYFSLMREGAVPGRVIMRPHHFSQAEGLVQLLRVVAQRRPNTFLANVSNPLGARFVRRLAGAFEAQGFTALTEVPLTEIDPALPDIDLLVISEEPTLGYVLVVCEVKSPLPPMWGKDQLKVLAPDSVSKAFRQLEAIKGFLGTGRGIGFLRSLLPEDGLEHFDDMVVIVKNLVITSANSGMFFGNEATPIMSFRTVERMLRKSDGDIAHILECIRSHQEGLDLYLETAMQVFQVGDIEVAYEACTGTNIVDFPQGDWRSSGRREKVIADFIAGGHQPFDVLKGRDDFIVAIPADAADADDMAAKR